MIDRERLYARFMELCAIDAEPKQERLQADRLTELSCEVTEDGAAEDLPKPAP